MTEFTTESLPTRFKYSLICWSNFATEMEQYLSHKFKICIACFLYNQRKCTPIWQKRRLMLVQFLQNIILSELCRLFVALIPISPAICIWLTLRVLYCPGRLYDISSQNFSLDNSPVHSLPRWSPAQHIYRLHCIIYLS